jgi:hypothetical protein
MVMAHRNRTTHCVFSRLFARLARPNEQAIRYTLDREFGFGRQAKKTEIPPDIGREQIPSPGNLKRMRKTRRAAKKTAATGEIRK